MSDFERPLDDGRLAAFPTLGQIRTPALDLLTRPVWVLDPDRACNVYANRAALAFWGAGSVDAFAARSHADMSATSRARLDEICRRVLAGQAVEERWTFYPQDRPTTVDLVHSGVRLDDGRLGLLIEATPGASDPTDRRAAEALRYAGVIAMLYDEDGCVLFSNPAAVEAYPGDEHRFPDRFVDPEEAEAVWAMAIEGEAVSTIARVATAAGERWHDLDVRRTPDPVTGRAAVLVSERDVTALKNTEATLRERDHKLAEAQEIVGLGDWRYDVDANEIHLSPMLAGICGLAATVVTPQALREIIWQPDIERLEVFLHHMIGDGAPAEIDFRVELSADRVKHLWLRCGPRRDADGRVAEIIGIARDVTEEMRARERVRFMALHDGLTGLANRLHFREELARAMRRGGQGGCLMMIDLDGFKEINDTHGHAAGDEVLREIGRRLLAAARGTDVVGRLGGDEFGIILPGLREIEVLDRRAEAIQQIVATPILVESSLITIGASIGLALWPANGETPDDLLRNVDLALFAVKAERGGAATFFTRQMRDAIDARRRIVEALPRAIEAGEIEVHFQPIVRLNRRELAGFEALVRWRSPVRGLIQPDEFISVAEDAGLMWQLGNHVLDASLRQMGEWRNAGLRPGRIAVNLGAGQLQNRGFARFVSEALSKAGLPPECLELEVTETVTLRRRAGAIVSTVEDLHRLGVGIVLDDFGTGHASLTHLKRLPIDRLKIDRSFVANIELDEGDAAIVRSLIGLARDLRLTVVAEGVETERQARFLVEAGCELGQGYLFGRPMPAADATRWLNRFRLGAPVR